MPAIEILHRCLDPLLEHIHHRRLATLLVAVASCVSGPALTLTDLGRRFTGTALLRHKIKRSDRLLGQQKLQSCFYRKVQSLKEAKKMHCILVLLLYRV